MMDICLEGDNFGKDTSVGPFSFPLCDSQEDVRPIRIIPLYSQLDCVLRL